MSKIVLNSVLPALLIAMLTVCKKEKGACSYNAEFCSIIQSGNYDSAGPVINKYLKIQDQKLSDSLKIVHLINWLKCKDCVSGVQILCVSCVMTNPEQSEIKINFLVNGRPVERVMDVIMSTPLKFRTFHE